MIFRVWGLI